MKKFMNGIDSLIKDSLDGLSTIHSNILTVDPSYQFVSRSRVNKNKVALVSGGGSGHEPLHTGFVGHGMLDAACPGQIFTSPTPDQILHAASAVSGAPGTLLIVKNYAGDLMNFEMATEMLEGKVAQVIVDDDISVQASGLTGGRRGVAGTMIVEKILGAAAEQGADLDALKKLGERVNASTRSMGVALSSCIVPAAGNPTFILSDHEMEMGVGIHGERGGRRVPLATAEEIATEMIGTILGELNLKQGQPCLLLVNGFGGTPLLELQIMASAAGTILKDKGFTIARGLAGSYITSLEMAGCSLTVLALDDELMKLWDAPVHTAALRWGM